MNSMFLVWTLSFLIVSYTLGFPIPNSTSSGFQMETFLNVTESNSTRYIKTNQTRPSLGMPFLGPSSGMPFLGPSSGMPPPGAIGLGCSLATCVIQNLADHMQTGDEKAGDITRDPWGPGKK